MVKQSVEGYQVTPTINLDHLPHIRGYDFEQKFDFDKFISSFGNTGFQASNLGKAIEIVDLMREDKATIFLGCTSNLVSSGLRDIIKYLVKNKMVHCFVTSAGGIEEDIIKCLKPFVLGSFDASGKMLNEKGVNRIGNIFVPNDRYTYFEMFMDKFFARIYAEKKQWSTVEFISELGREINNEESILYWAFKNNIPVFCPAITDGSLGDMIYFFKNQKKDFVLDVSGDMKKIVDLSMNSEKTGAIILGGGVSKHYILNANIFREGLDYAVYVNTAQEYDGCDSGAKIDEAVSWSKIKPDAVGVKVHADATLVFPLIVAATFGKK
ncbi:MAG: deoxyhypusine synthase [Candidatus Woesearchaeota archaeon]